MNMMTGTIMPPAAAPKPPVALLRALPPGALTMQYRKLQRLADLFAAFDRDDMELAVDLLLAELDASDGDPDSEAVGDELDGEPLSEDEWESRGCDDFEFGPGCPLADGGSPISGFGGDLGWTEWQSRGRLKVDCYGAEIIDRDRFGNPLSDDDGADDDRECDYRSHPRVAA